jgi:DNA invertase Pin-like site-specific DNA recombinase
MERVGAIQVWGRQFRRDRAEPVTVQETAVQSHSGSIYVRVSTKEQTENLSLPTQLRACEEYCRRQGYDIFERFHEEGERAKSTDGSQLQNLLTFCRLNKGRVHFVVVFNLTRFARDKYDHFALRSHLQSLGISLRSATEPIDDTSTGKLMEGVLAAFAQFDNDVRADRTRAGMKAATRIGTVAERVLPRAADLCVQASLEQRQRFQQLFFPDGIAFDGNRFIGTGVTARPSATCGRSRLGGRLVDLSLARWNQIAPWVKRLEALRLAG